MNGRISLSGSTAARYRTRFYANLPASSMAYPNLSLIQSSRLLLGLPRDLLLGTCPSRVAFSKESCLFLCPRKSNFRLYSEFNAHGGRVFQAVKSDLACVEESGFSADNCETIWTSLNISNCKTLYLSSFYRPQNSPPDVLDHFSDSINQVFTKVPNHPKIMIGGDLNFCDISWGNKVPSACNPATASQHNTFLQMMDDYSPTQHVKVPTRPVSGKILDLLLSTYPNYILSLG